MSDDLNMNLNSAATTAQSLYHCSFAKEQWDPSDWIRVKSPRWDRLGDWIQTETCIENQTPAGADPAQLRDAFAGQTYTSMLLDQTFSGAVEIGSTMEFADRMAPLIVIAKEPGKDQNGTCEYREHFEIVLFDKGVNIWHHYFENSQPSWEKSAFSRFALKPNIRHHLKIEIIPTPSGKRLSVCVGDHEFGYLDHSVPDEFYVGITGCEGVNRFYDFQVRKSQRTVSALETE
jgi:hypothetical protein